MVFKKGHKGYKNNGSFKKGSIPWNKDKKNYPTFVCPTCKKEFKDKGWKKRKFCSYKCSKIEKNNPNFNKKTWNYIDGRSKLITTARYGDDWDDIRYMVYRRDNFTCQECKKNNLKLDVHHIVPYLDGGSNEINNLISLCKSCHRILEAKLMKKRKEKNKED